jgi:acylglycerol lipase
MRPRGVSLGARLPRILAVLTIALLAACTPHLAPPGPGPAPGGGGIADGRLVTEDGLFLPLRVWRPDGPATAVILALHGFNDYSNAFTEPAADWAAGGIVTYAYDQRGFGAAPSTGIWPGSDALTGDLTLAARALKDRHPELPLFLLGESMGGAVIIAAVTGANPPPADGLILAAPAVWARSTMPWYQRAALWMTAHSFPEAKLTGQGLKIQASDNIEMLRGLGRDPLVIKATRVDAVYGLVDLMDQALVAAPKIDRPALLLYGERDEVVPKNPTFRLWRELPAAQRRDHRQALYANGWHMLLRDLDAATVRQDIAAWIADPTAPLPSGADVKAAATLAEVGSGDDS